MRTTLTLDDDVAAAIERLQASRDQSLKDVVNEALRAGLAQLEQPPPPRRKFRTATVDLGRCLVGSIDNVADVLAVVESEAFR
jgi:hypothetical protein